MSGNPPVGLTSHQARTQIKVTVDPYIISLIRPNPVLLALLLLGHSFMVISYGWAVAHGILVSVPIPWIWVWGLGIGD